jgi:hypothetical protein
MWFPLILVVIQIAIIVSLLLVLIRPGKRLLEPASYQQGAKVVRYRTKDGLCDYVFSLERVGGSYRVYIVQRPSYGSRNRDLLITHINVNGTREFVCWKYPILTEKRAKSIAKAWAEGTQEYIKTGKRFG